MVILHTVPFSGLAFVQQVSKLIHPGVEGKLFLIPNLVNIDSYPELTKAKKRLSRHGLGA